MFKLNDHDRVLLRMKQRHQRMKKYYVKITTLLMLDSGFSAQQTADALGIDDATVYRYAKNFSKANSIDEYLEFHYQGSQPRLSNEQLHILLDELTSTLHRTAASVANFIRTRFCVNFAERSARSLLQRLGFRFKKTRLVPAKADPETQEHFLRYNLLGLLRRARNRQEPVYFCDAVHPQYNTRAAYGWIPVAEQWPVQSTSGRQRLNLNGALNAEDPSDAIVLPAERIDTKSTIALFTQIRERHPHGRIHIVCDNASYYRSRAVTSWLKKNNICVLYLPPYSTNLNLIERLWKYMRSVVIDTTYYADFATFTQAITKFFENISEHSDKLRSLLIPNFHIPHVFAN